MSQLTTRTAIERLHNDERLRSNLTDDEARWLLTLAEHTIIRLSEMEWLDEQSYEAVEQFVAKVNDSRGWNKLSTAVV